MRGSGKKHTTIAALLAAALLAGPAAGDPHRQRQLPNGVAGSLDRAEAKLRRRECAAIFTDFHDLEGRTLAEKLEATGLAGHAFMDSLTFARGDNFRSCMNGTLAFTAPGNRVVYVCEMNFLLLERYDAERAAHILIHEALHALGLGENPPTSRQITDAVARRCHD